MSGVVPRMGADDALDFDKCILGQPNPACWLVKRYFQHAFHKKTKTGKGIFIVRMRKRPFQYEVFTDHVGAHIRSSCGQAVALFLRPLLPACNERIPAGPGTRVPGRCKQRW